MFNKDFYPTPKHAIEQMGIDCFDKVVLEPSAGKGDIVDFLRVNGAKEIFACELNDDLRKIVATKCNIISDDFLNVSAEMVSHIELIVMNPPFTSDEKHILHAWKIAPEGCEIISLCNWETCNNSYYSSRRELNTLISDYGEAINMGDVFTKAERKTGVEIGLVRLFKPVVSKYFDWDGFFYSSDTESSGNGLMPYNEIRAIVNAYVAAVNCFDEVEVVSNKMQSLIGAIKFSDGGVCFKAGYNDNDVIYSKKDFARLLQIHCWKQVFDKMKIAKYVTKGVLEDINKFVKSRSNYPFTMKNIYRMLDIIIGTRDETMKRAIVEAVDKFTKHTHENRLNIEGWKTNEGHLLNQKFISGWICQLNYTKGVGIKYWNGNFEYLQDLTKAICFLTGKNYDDIPSISLSSAKKDSEGRLINENVFETNTWYVWGFFKFKLYKKGTGHFQFLDENVWGILNQAYAKAKGCILPEKIKVKKNT